MLKRIINIAAGVGMGALLSQGPEFTQQYQQRLGGALDELSTITQQFDQTAAKSELNREEALTRFDNANDEFLAQRGTDMRAVFSRYQRLTDHMAAIEGAGMFAQFVPMIQYLDPQLASGTYRDYRPAVPITLAGIVFAFLGVLLGYGLSSGLWALAGKLAFRRRKQV